ncbi:MAG: hypothetical protein L0226_03970, partial [Acidobacteria bacterium]|nr:hypothetical protein [Acidobacteriota bacterium]
KQALPTFCGGAPVNDPIHHGCADCGLRIADLSFPGFVLNSIPADKQAAICNPQSAIRNPLRGYPQVVESDQLLFKWLMVAYYHHG